MTERSLVTSEGSSIDTAIPPTRHPRIAPNPLGWLLLLALAIKLPLLIADSAPQVFLGDSGSYLYTAMTGWIPPDRSFLYGFVIRWITFESASLFSLVLAQTLAASVSAALAGWLIWRFTASPRWGAALGTFLCALEPIQLMYERFVMAETFSLLAAVIFVCWILVFIDTGLNRYLAFASILGLIAVAFRISYLPLVFAFSFSAPLFRYFICSKGTVARRAQIRWLLLSLAITCLCYASLHTAYKILNGRLSGAPPAYQYADGFSLLSSWYPAITSADLASTGASPQLLDGLAPATLERRRSQRWSRDGVVFRLTESYHNPLEANAISKKIALHILSRNPFAVANLALRTYFRSWHRDAIKASIYEDTGSHRPVPDDLLNSLSQRYHVTVDANGRQNTLTKTYFGRLILWYRILLVSPLLLLVTALLGRKVERPLFWVLAFYATVLLATAVGLAVDNSIRYLHPLGWTMVIPIGYWAGRLIDYPWNFGKLQPIFTSRHSEPKLRLRGKFMDLSKWLTGKRLEARVLILIAFCGIFICFNSRAAGEGPQGLYVKNGVLMHEGHPYRGIGANYHTLFGNLLKNKDDTTSLDNLAKLGKIGIPFVRFRAGGFGPQNQELYLRDRSEFFRRMDQVVACAEKNHIGLIPSLFWRLATVSETVGEDRSQLANPSSKSCQFIRQFTQQMVSRYNDSPAIWGWEFGNEANLGVDISPQQKRFNGFNRPSGGGGLSSQQLASIYAMFARTVRKIDPSRIIEPGTTIPRASAWHLAHAQGWGRDDFNQTLSMLVTLTPDPMNVTSAHVYEKAKATYPTNNGTAGVLASLMTASNETGKPLFIGEFPVKNADAVDEFLRAIEVNRVPLSAFWVFDFPPQESTMNVSLTNRRAFVLDRIVQANKVLQNGGGQ